MEATITETTCDTKGDINEPEHSRVTVTEAADQTPLALLMPTNEVEAADAVATTIACDASDAETETLPAIAAPTPPPVPEAARLHRPRPVDYSPPRDFDYDRDLYALSDRDGHTLTFPPTVSPEPTFLPRVESKKTNVDWRVFGAIVMASIVSTAATASAAYIAGSRSPHSMQHQGMSAQGAGDKTEDAVARSRRPTVNVTHVSQGDLSGGMSVRARSSQHGHRAGHVAVPSLPDPYLPEQPFPTAVQMAAQRARGAIMMCGLGVPNATPTVRAHVSYASDGTVSHVTLSSPWQGTEPGRCMTRVLVARAAIPPFRAETYQTTFAFAAQ